MLDPAAPLEIHDEIDSTNLEARRRAERGDAGPAWIMARAQTAGRGRRGRSWASAPGNLFVTYLGATTAAPAAIAQRGFAVGLAIAEMFDLALGEPIGRVRLKWPNDVMIDGAKASGILLDSGPLDAGRRWAAIGFGVNLAAHPEGLDQPTASLAEALGAAPPSPEDAFALIRPRLEAWDRRLDREGFAPLRAAWLARAHGLGARVTAQIGAETIAGLATGLSESGELMIETERGVRYISAGDIHFPNSAA
jgi:BirA family biotin operon repressor/biotin-[acetyl-CoA-carboxylase] ligase